MLDEPLELPAVLGRELAGLGPHVAQEHHVELGELVQTLGELP